MGQITPILHHRPVNATSPILHRPVNATSPITVKGIPAYLCQEQINQGVSDEMYPSAQLCISQNPCGVGQTESIPAENTFSSYELNCELAGGNDPKACTAYHVCTWDNGTCRNKTRPIQVPVCGGGSELSIRGINETPVISGNHGRVLPDPHGYVPGADQPKHYDGIVNTGGFLGHFLGGLEPVSVAPFKHEPEHHMTGLRNTGFLGTGLLGGTLGGIAGGLGGIAGGLGL